MKISEIIQLCKDKSTGMSHGVKIDDKTTRDQILFGNPDQEVTSIVSTLFASVDVIKKAIELGANFIIVHEALFWNHGDHQDWISGFETYQQKKKLLEENHICVWRNHDYIHSGIDVDGVYRDGIFYGLAEILGWNQYSIEDSNNPMCFEIPKMKVRDLAQYLMERMNLTGIKCMGNLDCEVSKIMIPTHLIGARDNEVTKKVNDDNYECLICMEVTDFTTAEYIRDCAQLNQNKCLLAVGHFNVEEPGMDYFAGWLRKQLNQKIEVKYIQSGDAYQFITKS